MRPCLIDFTRQRYGAGKIIIFIAINNYIVLENDNNRSRIEGINQNYFPILQVWFVMNHVTVSINLTAIIIFLL